MANKHDQGLYLSGPRRGQKDPELADCQDPSPGLGTIQKGMLIIGGFIVLISIVAHFL